MTDQNDDEHLEGGELVEREPTAVADAPTQGMAAAPDSGNVLDVLLSDPSQIAHVDTDKLEKLFELQQRGIEARGKRAFYSEMATAKTKFTRVQRDKPNPQTRSLYAPLESITAMLDPIISQHGFSYSLDTAGTNGDGDNVYVLIVRHAAGHSESTRIALPIDDEGLKKGKNKTRIHGLASSYTYATRLLLCRFFGVETGDVDDDGNAGAGHGKPAPEPLITVEQQAELTAWIERAEMNETKLLAIYAVEKVAELPAKLYPGALRMAKIRHENNEAKRKQAQGDAA